MRARGKRRELLKGARFPQYYKCLVLAIVFCIEKNPHTKSIQKNSGLYLGSNKKKFNFLFQSNLLIFMIVGLYCDLEKTSFLLSYKKVSLIKLQHRKALKSKATKSVPN